ACGRSDRPSERSWIRLARRVQCPIRSTGARASGRPAIRVAQSIAILGAILDSLLQATNSDSATHPHGGATDVRPGLAIVANVMTPYRANLHRLVAAGIPELKLHTLVTHGVGDFDWSVAVPPEINTTDFSTSGEHPLDNPLRRPIGEFRKASRLIR